MNSKLLFFPVVGRPFAITDLTIMVIIRMKVLSEKRMELSQTIAALSGSLIRMEKGCQPSSQIEILNEEYHEIQHEGPGGRHISPSKG